MTHPGRGAIITDADDASVLPRDRAEEFIEHAREGLAIAAVALTVAGVLFALMFLIMQAGAYIRAHLEPAAPTVTVTCEAPAPGEHIVAIVTVAESGGYYTDCRKAKGRTPL